MKAMLCDSNVSKHAYRASVFSYVLKMLARRIKGNKQCFIFVNLLFL